MTGTGGDRRLEVGQTGSVACTRDLGRGSSDAARCPVRRGILVLLFVVGSAVLSSGCANRLTTKAPVTIEQVIEMSRNGTDAPNIIARMRETGTVFRLSASSLAMLRSEGVPTPVLDYMWQTRWLAEREQADECYRWIWCIMGPPYFAVK